MSAIMGERKQDLYGGVVNKISRFINRTGLDNLCCICNIGCTVHCFDFRTWKLADFRI